MSITFEDFKKLEIKIGRVLSAEKVEGEPVFLHPSKEIPPGSLVK